MPLATVEPPAWWLEHASDDHWDERRVFAGGARRNAADGPVVVTLAFRAYSRDGEIVGSCDAEQHIEPGETARFACQAADRRWTTRGLQLTTRLVHYGPDHAQAVSRAAAAGVDKVARYPDVTMVTTWARVRAPARENARATVRFRLYDKAGARVATCLSADADLQPEVARRVESFADCPSVPRRFGPVARGEADVLDRRE